jgi:hypothetical protein
MLTKKVFQIGMAPFAQSFLTAAGFDLSVWNASVGSQVPPPPPSSAPLAERVEWLFGRSIGGEEKRLFGAILYLKTEHLPRRARDKRRENSNKRCVLCINQGSQQGATTQRTPMALHTRTTW